MEPSFKSAVERGVKVFVITKALGDRGRRELSNYRMLEATLEKWGIIVIHKRRMHEKLAIIDNHILWIGSLNILSFSSTREIMERRLSNNVVDDFIKTLRIHDLLKEYERGKPSCPICGSEVVASEGRNDPYYWRCIVDKCYARSIDQPPITSGIITCSNCGGEVEFGEWGGKPHWRCLENRSHRQRIAKTHLTLPKIRQKIPKRELKKLEELFGFTAGPSQPNNAPRQMGLFDKIEVQTIEKEIIPGQSVGEFKLGPMDDVISTYIESNCEQSEYGNGYIYKSDSIWFWQNQDSKEISQICVMNTNDVKYSGTIGIDSPLKDVIVKLPSLKVDGDASENEYSSPSEPGIIFGIQEGLEKAQHKELGRIEVICVYKVY
jgi:hypothetical protein